MEKYEDDKKKKDKKFAKKVKKVKALTGKVSPVTSRMEMSTNILHTPSIPESSEEEEEENEGEQNGSSDLSAYSRKKGDPKSASTGKLLCKYKFSSKNIIYIYY